MGYEIEKFNECLDFIPSSEPVAEFYVFISRKMKHFIPLREAFTSHGDNTKIFSLIRLILIIISRHPNILTSVRVPMTKSFCFSVPTETFGDSLKVDTRGIQFTNVELSSWR